MSLMELFSKIPASMTGEELRFRRGQIRSVFGLAVDGQLVTNASEIILQRKITSDLKAASAIRDPFAPSVVSESLTRTPTAAPQQHDDIVAALMPTNTLRRANTVGGLETLDQKQLQNLSRHSADEVLFACPAIQPAIAATLIRMCEDFSVPIAHCDFRAEAGASILNRYVQDAQDLPVFIIMGNAPVFLTQHDHVRRDYRFLCPLYQASQSVLVRTDCKNRPLKRVFYVPGTSADEQVRVAGDNPGVEFVKVDLWRLIDHAVELDVGEGVIAWAPLSDGLCDAPARTSARKLIALPKQEYRYDVGLHVSVAGVERLGLPLARAVFMAFVAAWRRTLIEAQPGEAAFKRAKKSTDFLTAFEYANTLGVGGIR